MEALLDHPKVTDAQRKVIIRRLLSEPHTASFDDIVTLHETLARVRKLRNLPNKIDAVPPQHYATEQDYSAALEDYAMHLANSHEITDPPIWPSELRNTLRASIPQLKREGLIVLSFGSRTEAGVRQLSIPQSFTAEINGSGGGCCFGEFIRTFVPAPRESSGPKGVQAALKQSQLDALDDEGEVAATRETRSRPYYYRTFVLYHPDPWYRCYGIWALYGGPARGREILENPQLGVVPS